MKRPARTPPRQSVLRIRLTVCVAAALSISVILPLAAAAPTSVDENRTVPAAEYSWVLLYAGAMPEDMVIDLNWTATVASDVWLMDRTNWDNFEAGRAFTADLTQTGLSGHINATIAGARLAAGSMYVVLDNSDRGATPSPGTPATFHVQGVTWRPPPPSTTNEGGLMMLNVIRAVVVAIPLLAILALVVRRRNKKKRKALIREHVAAGKVVGDGEARPPEAYAPPPPPPPPYGAPPQYNQVQAPRQAAPAPRFCRRCGAPGVTGKAFCMQCGAPFGP